MKRKNIRNKRAFNDKLPYEVPDCIGEISPIKKNENEHMNKLFLVIFILVLSICTLLIFGCTAMDPIADKNVSYTFENVSYESPNSSPHDNIGEAEGKFNFDKKLPIG